MRTLHAILSLGLTLFLLPSYGQEDNPRIPAEITNLQVSINILEPSVVIEKMVTEKNTFTLSAGITTLNQFNEDFDASKFTINPQVRSSFRHYYPRKKVEKVLRPNSGN